MCIRRRIYCTRCFSSLLPADTYISDLARSSHKCFLHCPMLHFLPLEVKESFPQMSLSTDCCCFNIRSGDFNTVCMLQLICYILALPWKHLSPTRDVYVQLTKYKRTKATSLCMPLQYLLLWSSLNETLRHFKALTLFLMCNLWH